jgi:hypothetical protein
MNVIKDNTYTIIMLSVKNMIFGYIFYNLSPHYLFFMIYYLFKIKKYIISGDKEVTNALIKKMSNHIIYTEVTHINGKNNPSGLFIGNKYYGYIEIKDGTTVTLYAKEETYNSLMEQEEIEIEVKPKPIIKNKINVFIRKGSYRSLYYSSMRLDLSHINPIGEQQSVIDSIKNIYTKNGSASVFINGVAGAGKSTIGYLLAKELNGSYCHTFNPTEPGDYLSNLMVDIRVDDDPVIIVIEEVDIMIQKIDKGLDKNNEIPIEIYNKTTWNNFMDDLIFYKIILIFTSNTSKKDLDKIDSCYLRKGRIDEYYYMNTSIEKLKKTD